jgi:uncharacterized membrane protein YfcA
MSAAALIVLIIVFFLTTVVGVVTGSNSLITVPVMFQLGIEPKIAVATNMFGLTFMAIGATIPFVRRGKIEFGRIMPLVVLTVVGSAIGAALVGMITSGSIKLIVSVAMIAVALFTLLQRQKGIEKPDSVSATALAIAFILTFLLGIYGGLYSGGYVTVLTASYVAFFGMTFSEAVASTKFINIFSSGVATLVFAWQGLIDYRLGFILAVTMFAGAYIGAHYATRLNDLLLKRIFLTTVFLLAFKTIYDLLGN